MDCSATALTDESGCDATGRGAAPPRGPTRTGLSRRDGGRLSSWSTCKPPSPPASPAPHLPGCPRLLPKLFPLLQSCLGSVWSIPASSKPEPTPKLPFMADGERESRFEGAQSTWISRALIQESHLSLGVSLCPSGSSQALGPVQRGQLSEAAQVRRGQADLQSPPSTGTSTPGPAPCPPQRESADSGIWAQYLRVTAAFLTANRAGGGHCGPRQTNRCWQSRDQRAWQPTYMVAGN